MIEALADEAGIILRRDVVRAGYRDESLTSAVRRRSIVRIRQGAYCLAPIWADASRVERHLLLVAAVRRQYSDDVALSHVSAALEQGGPNWGLDLSAVHLTHLNGTGGRRSAGIVHHHGTCLADDITRDEAGWVTAPTRTALDAASNAPRGPAVAVLDWYLNEGLTTPDQLARGFERMTHWPDTLALQMALRLADGTAESVAETRSRLLFYDEGLPPPIPQFKVFRPTGALAGRVDFAWPERRTMVEVDGAEKYHRYRRPGETLEQMVMREKRREDLLRELTGWILIRLTWPDLGNPRATAARIRRAFEVAAA